MLIHLLMITGCRRGEIVGLKWDCVNCADSSIRIDTTLLYTPDRGVYESTTKTGADRTIKLPKETMEQLLIIEDDIGLNQGLSKALKADDRQIISCQDLKTAKEQLLCGGVSLILLDINLPDYCRHRSGRRTADAGCPYLCRSASGGCDKRKY